MEIIKSFLIDNPILMFIFLSKFFVRAQGLEADALFDPYNADSRLLESGLIDPAILEKVKYNNKK